ncbi:MAG: hypothetical protein CMH62_02560 [Nanoarchaeota archaeon]|nr:hypothetical protein [Nanoarchaeota archaeon]
MCAEEAIMSQYELDYDFLEASKKGKIGEKIFHRLRVKTMTNMIKGSNMKILDIGCGTGILFEHFNKNNNKVVGVDISKWCISKANEHAENIGLEHELYVGDAFNLKFQNSKFDFIILSGVMEHLRGDLNVVVWKIRNLLKKDGKVLVSLPSYHPLNPLSYEIVYDFFRKVLSGRKDIEEEGEHKHFNVKELRNLFKGFKVLKVKNTALGVELCMLFQKV